MPSIGPLIAAAAASVDPVAGEKLIADAAQRLVIVGPAAPLRAAALLGTAANAADARHQSQPRQDKAVDAQRTLVRAALERIVRLLIAPQCADHPHVGLPPCLRRRSFTQ